MRVCVLDLICKCFLFLILTELHVEVAVVVEYGCYYCIFISYE